MIFHLTSIELWEKALNEGYYKHPTLQTEGFIHCSTKDQLLPTALRHFKDYSSDLIVLHIVESRIKSCLKYEEASNGELYPHIYCKIPIDVFENCSTLIRNDEGNWEWFMNSGL